MKKLDLLVTLIFMVGSIFIATSQSTIAKIYKNKNIQASGLYHDLNKTKDTLILKSEQMINYIYTANNDGRRDINKRINNTEYRLPLNELDKGKNVIVAVQSPLQIVFVVQILKDLRKTVKVSQVLDKRKLGYNSEKVN